MRAEFQVRIKVDYLPITSKHEMTSWVEKIVKDLTAYLGDSATDIELLNHTLVFSG